MKRFNTILLIMSAWLALLPACQKEILPSDCDQSATTDSLTLTLSLDVAPVAETKGSARVATKGGEAEKAGFFYEFVEDTTVMAQTKAPSSLKNIYAFLFNGTSGAYIGKGTLTSASANTPLSITFSQTAATSNCRLIVVAQDGSATYLLPSSLSGFTGSYDLFKKIALSGVIIASEKQIPYVGELTGVSTISGDVGNAYTVNLYRMLAKVTLNLTNNVPGLSLLTTLSNVSSDCFLGTSNGYDGSGVIPTTGTFRSNGSGPVWYVGENIQGNAVGSCSGMPDRNKNNAPINAAYIRLSGRFNNSEKTGGLGYDIYLGTGVGSGAYGDFNLRRNNNYTINVALSGTLEEHILLSKSDKRMRSLTVSSAPLTIPASGGSVSVSLDVTVGEYWDISQTGGSTMNIIPDYRSGEGSAVISFTAPVNSTGSIASALFRCSLMDGGSCEINITQLSCVGDYQVASVNTYSTMNYADAERYCYDLSVDGFSDWLLPSSEVLTTLLENTGLSTNEQYWTSTYRTEGQMTQKKYFITIMRYGSPSEVTVSYLQEDVSYPYKVPCVRKWR